MPNTTDTCTIDGCERKKSVRLYCQMHYLRDRKGTDMFSPPKGSGICSVEGCVKKFYAYSMCRSHWRAASPNVCTIHGCERPKSTLGMCAGHVWRHRKGMDLTTPLRPTAKRGESVWHRMPSGYIARKHQIGGKSFHEFQHRAVMEAKIGRPLLKHENVHHINGVRDDNRPENLELWSKSQPSGQRVADKLEWAREILALYGD